MANHQSKRKVSYSYKQDIYDKPQRVLVGTYLTKKGLELKKEGATEETLKKYTKNRYRVDNSAKIVKTIKHIIPQRKEQ